jgi:succinate dehydrogenase / fumarate reductase, cytochrome b subunit
MLHSSLSRWRWRLARWVDPRGRQPGTWAFMLNRLSGLGLTLYLFLHLGVLGLLAQGPAAYDRFIALAKSPAMAAGELLVVVAGLYHGLNGLRVAMTSLGIGVRHQRLLFAAIVLLVIGGGIVFAARMF